MDRTANIFTIDTEDWFHANYKDNLFSYNSETKSTVEANTEKLLQIFAEYGLTATFFVLGFVAEQYPGLVRKISNAGHEVASHGYGHQLIYKHTKDEFREDIRKGKKLVEDIIGNPVLGYRAPSWSITKESLWALDILIEEGFLYDSSIFPTKNFLYGIEDASRFIYKPVVNGEEKNIWEIPPSTAKVAGKNVPFSGGFYFRACPLVGIKLFSYMIKREKQAVIYYLHPREIDPDQPKLTLSKKDAVIHYIGIKGCQRKLISVITNKEFLTIEKYIKRIENS